MAGQANVLSKLKDAIEKIPLIDSHAHNLLQSYEPSPDLPRESLVSLADGEPLKDLVYSLAHIRMLKNLACFFNLPVDSSWQTINETAKARDYDLLCRDLVEAAGIQVILIDDSIQNDYRHDISWHDQLTPAPNKRIVCIETLFESIVDQNGRQTAFIDFPAAIRKLADDPDVAGFMSVAACRSGLDVQPLDSNTLFVDWGVAFREVREYAHSPFRVDKHAIVTWLVNATCSVISGKGKPLRFHTGLRDNDVTLSRADASLLQPLIKAYPEVPFVLLHSGYPYARQAGYLATVYPNVYIDFGLAIPLLSGDGQRSLIRQLLELCPTNKLLWSSGTAFHPEHFYVAALQTRVALTEILADYICRDEIGFDEAIQVAKRMLFENANKLYNLNIDYVELVLNKVIDVESNVIEEKSDKETDDEVHIPEALIYSVKLPTPSESPELTKPESPLLEVSEPIRATKTSRETTSTLITKLRSRDIKFVRIAWVDYVNYTRYHTVSIERFVELIGPQLNPPSPSYPFEHLAESGPSVAQAALGMLVDDVITPGVSISGYYSLKPDFSTMWTPPFPKGYAHMLGRFFHGMNNGGEELKTCPRTILQGVIRQAERELGVKFLVGFETGFVLLQNDNLVSTGRSSASVLQCGSVADCVHEITQNIVDAGIKLNKYEAKNAYSQYEIVTGPLPPMQAASALVATRETIYYIARKHNFRASLVPRLRVYQAVSTSSRVHISVQSASSNMTSNHPDVPSLPKDLASFMSGLLTHLGSVCMFTLPLDACYPRVADDPLNASVWACWGTENMEAPVRLCESERGEFNVELRTFDGTANPYLSLAAILGAGITGLKEQAVLEMRDCGNVSSKDVPNTNYGHQRSVRLTQLAEDWRLKLGITMKMPTANEVFASETSERTDFIKTWLPEEAWKLYKDVRNHERNTFYNPQYSRTPANHCSSYY